MWSVWQTCRTGRRVAGFLGGLLVAFLLAVAPAAAATFSDPVTLSNGGEATTPAVAVASSGQVYVAWREGNDVFFTRSLPSRGSCSGPGRLEFLTPARNLSEIDTTKISRADSPSIAANDGGGVFVAWREVPLFGSGAVQSIRSARSIDGGVTFTSPQSLEFNRFAPISPAVATDNSNGVFVAWQDSSAGKSFVAVAQSLDGGATFSYGNITANRTSSSRQPSLGSDGSKVHVVWRETGVWYKGFTRGSDLATVGSAPAMALTTLPVSPFPKIGVQGSQVTAAWFEGGNIKARTMTDGLSFGAEETINSSTNSLFGLSLSFGGAGRFVGWQEADFTALTSSIRYRLGTASPETLRSGSLAANAAAPSVGEDGTDRLVASWQETGTTTEIKLAYTGGSTGGGMMPATVWAAPRVLNYRTMYRGTGEQPNFTVFIELADGSAGDIDLSSVKLNGYTAMPAPSALGDANGNGIPDMMVKFNRDVFNGTELTAAQRNGNYTVTGNTRSGGCFSGGSAVQIMR